MNFKSMKATRFPPLPYHPMILDKQSELIGCHRYASTHTSLVKLSLLIAIGLVFHSLCLELAKGFQQFSTRSSRPFCVEGLDEQVCKDLAGNLATRICASAPKAGSWSLQGSAVHALAATQKSRLCAQLAQGLSFERDLANSRSPVTQRS